MSFARMLVLAKKELLILLRDPRVRMVLIGPPLIQLIIFSFAATLEVKNATLAVYNQDNGIHATEIIERIKRSSVIRNTIQVSREEDLRALIEEQKALVALSIPMQFSRTIEQGNTAKVQIVFHGGRSNAAQITISYFLRIIGQYEQELRQAKGLSPPRIIIAERNWFNENLLFSWVTVSSLVGVLAMLITLMVTALSIAREKEMGTFDQLLVSPLTPYEILLGKTLPAMLIGFVEGMLIYAASMLVFDIPFTGSFLLLVFSLCVFIYSVVGIGLFISALAQTQQQAILGTFMFMVPAMALSGFATPVENMPEFVQMVTQANPLRHGLVLFRGIFLKNMPFELLWSSIWPLLMLGTASLALATVFFTKKLE